MADKDWLKQFFALPVVNEPGTAFYYSGSCSAVAGAIVRQKTGFVGYGLQCWMCKPEGVYRADGGLGQFSTVIPDLDMVISIHETADQSQLQHQKVLDAVWDEFLPHISGGGFIPAGGPDIARISGRILGAM